MQKFSTWLSVLSVSLSLQYEQNYQLYLNQSIFVVDLYLTRYVSQKSKKKHLTFDTKLWKYERTYSAMNSCIDMYYQSKRE